MLFSNEQNLLYPVVINALNSVYKGEKFNEKMTEVFLAVMGKGEKGISTRDVAEHCDLSVYSARNWLMRLEEKNLIVRRIKTRNTIWLWASTDE